MLIELLIEFNNYINKSSQYIDLIIQVYIIFVFYNFVLHYFLSILFIYISQRFLIPFYDFYIIYEFGRIFDDKLHLSNNLNLLFRNFVVVNYSKHIYCFFLKEDSFLKNYYIFISIISEKYILILNFIHLFALFLKYLRTKRTCLSLGTWTVKK